MTFRVGVTYGGDVVIVLDDGLRFDLSPEQATRLAADMRSQIKRGGDIVFVTAEAMQGRSFRFAGNLDSAAQLAGDLEKGAVTGPREPEPEEAA